MKYGNYNNYKDIFSNTIDFYTQNKNELDKVFESFSNKYQIPYENIKDSYLREILSILTERRKTNLKKKKNIVFNFIFYYGIMFVVFFSTFFRNKKKNVQTDILFDGTDIGWYFNHYKFLDQKKPLGLKSKLFVGANSYKRYESYIQPGIKSITEIDIINRWKSWYCFESSIARKVIKNEFFNFFKYNKLSSTLEIDFVNISLRIIRSILVSESESKNITVKYLLTFGDHYFNGIRYYTFKKNGIKNIVAIQNGLRLGISTDSMFINCDYYYAFNKDVFEYLKGLNCEHKISSGSIKAALFLEQLKEYKEVVDFDILLINHPMESSEHSQETRDMYMQTVKYLSRYVEENPKIKINFLLKSTQVHLSNPYFNEIKSLMKKANATFQYSGGLDSYKSILTSKVIINMYSSLERESYSFRRKVLNINCNNIHEPIFKFTMEDDIGTLVECSYEKFSHKLNKLLDDNDLEVKEFYKTKFEENKIFYDNPIQMFYDSLETKKV